MTIRARLEKLEAVRQRGDEPLIITVMGGIADEPLTAEAGAERLERETGETLAVFRVRAVAAGRANGARFVVIGGLPHG